MAHSHGGDHSGDKGDSVHEIAFILLVALELLFSRFISFRVITYFFSPAYALHIYTYSYISTPDQYRIDVGVFLMLRRPE